MLKRKTNKYACKKKGQSTVEYILLAATIIAALVIFLAPNGPFQNAFNSTLATGTNGMVNMAERLATSRPLAP